MDTVEDIANLYGTPIQHLKPLPQKRGQQQVRVSRSERYPVLASRNSVHMGANLIEYTMPFRIEISSSASF